MVKMFLRGFVLLVASVFGLPGQAGHSDADPVQIVERFFDAYRARDVGRMMRLVAVDVRFEDPTFRLAANGREELRKIGSSLQRSYSDVTIDMHTIVASGERVAAELTIGAIVKRKDGSTRRIKVRGASFFLVRDGFITTWTDYYDFQTFSEQLR